MDNLKALEYTRENQQRLMSTIDPLMGNFPVACFVYMELINSNDFFLMSSDTAWGDEYLMRGLPGETWVQGLRHAASQENPTHVSWALHESVDPIEQYCVDLGYRFGMNIYKNEGNKLKLWAFDGLDAQSLQCFQAHKAELEQFTFYFNEQCADLITEDRLKENAAHWSTPQDFGINSLANSIPHPSPELFPVRHISLIGDQGSVTLTFRQWEILKKAAQGLSMKEIGRALNISPRTVESSLIISKEKARAHNQKQISHFVSRNCLHL